jgi:hypothetical protein
MWGSLVLSGALAGCSSNEASPEPKYFGRPDTSDTSGTTQDTGTEDSDDTGGEAMPAEGSVSGMCSDGLDNDADGLVDCDDPSCASDIDCWDPSAEAPLRTVHLTGTVWDGLTMTQMEGYFCLELATVGSLFAGGDVTIISTAESNDDGTWELRDIELSETSDLLLSVSYCLVGEDTLLESGTRISPAEHSVIEDGGTLDGIRALTLGRDQVEQMDMELREVGMDIATRGTLFTHILDADGAPLEGATFQAADAAFPAYYPDTGEALLTDASGDFRAATGSLGLAIVPAGWTGTYRAAAAGYNFPSLTALVIHRQATFTRTLAFE